jgi:hypothetical protein
LPVEDQPDYEQAGRMLGWLLFAGGMVLFFGGILVGNAVEASPKKWLRRLGRSTAVICIGAGACCFLLVGGLQR